MSNADWCDIKRMHEWTEEEICDYYDMTPNLTVLTFAGMLGLSSGELKAILTSRHDD